MGGEAIAGMLIALAGATQACMTSIKNPDSNVIVVEGSSEERMREAVLPGKVSDQVQGTASNVGDRVQGAASNVADKAGDMADYAQWQAQRTRGWLERTWDDNPLLVAGAAAARLARLWFLNSLTPSGKSVDGRRTR